MLEITKRLEKRNAELSRIRTARARWWRKLSRAATAIDKLNVEEKRLLRPRKLEAHEALKVDSRDWHKIRETEFNDTIGF